MPDVPVQPEIPQELRAELERVRDGAEALTPAEVMLDERVRERWLLEAERLAPLAEEERLPPELKDEVNATMTALREVQVLR
jgi:hypothetical protein